MTLTRPTLAVALAATLALTACASTDPSTLAEPADPNRNAKQAAIFGGLLGAGVGAVSGASNKTTAVLAGAAVGAIAGGALGAQLDRQEAELRAQLAADGITIRNTGDRLIVSLPQDITFATDSYQVTPGLQAEIAKVAQILLKYPKSTVQVIGHTDSDGDAAYNVTLSQRRANAVADILQANGVPYNRLTTIGRGEAEPIASNLSAAGKAQNRRVEIVIIPTD